MRARWSFLVVPHLRGQCYQVFGDVVLIADQGSEAANRRLARLAWRSSRVAQPEQPMSAPRILAQS
jgi:hypothetical protein